MSPLGGRSYRQSNKGMSIDGAYTLHMYMSAAKRGDTHPVTRLHMIKGGFGSYGCYIFYIQAISMHEERKNRERGAQKTLTCN